MISRSEALAETSVRQRWKSRNNVPQSGVLTCRDFPSCLTNWVGVFCGAMKKKTLTTAKSKKKPATKNKKKPAAKSAKLTAKSRSNGATKSNAKPAVKRSAKKAGKGAKKRTRKAPFIGITKPYGFRIRADGTLETKEERAKRLARLEALTLRAFQITYDNYHRK